MQTASNNQVIESSHFLTNPPMTNRPLAHLLPPIRCHLAQDVVNNSTSLLRADVLNSFSKTSSITSFLDSLTEFVYFKDLENNNLLVNKAVADALGTTPEEMAGTATEQWYPQHASRYHEDDKVVIDSGQPKRNIIEPIVDANGVHRQFRTDKFPLRDEKHNIHGILVVAQEVFHDDSLYQKLDRAARLEVLGLLAKGATHSFKNMLWIAQTHLDVAKNSLATGHPAQENLAAVTEALQHCSDLTNRLLAQGRAEEGEHQAVHLDELISDTALLFSTIMPEDINLRVNFGDDVPMVYANPFQISEVILNLVLNARDALPNGGVITLSTSSIVTKGDKPNYSVMSVLDTGPGIDPKILPRLFLPYSTTKSGGFGIGLASCRLVVNEHGGDITVARTDDEQTEFSVLLPSLN